MFKHVRSSLPILVCECGAELLILPDITEMYKSITKHAEKHQLTELDPHKAEATSKRIQNLLLEQLREKARNREIHQTVSKTFRSPSPTPALYTRRKKKTV